MVKPYSSFNRFEPQFSVVVPVATGLIDLNIDPSRVHHFAGVVFYNDADGKTPVQPSAGTATFQVILTVQPQALQDISNNVLDDLTEPCQVNWAGNTEAIRVTFDSITGATHARLIWAGNSA